MQSKETRLTQQEANRYGALNRSAIALMLMFSFLVSGCSDESSDQSKHTNGTAGEAPDVYAFIDPDNVDFKMDGLTAELSVSLRVQKINKRTDITESGFLYVTCSQHRPHTVSLFIPVGGLTEFNKSTPGTAGAKYNALIAIPQASFEYRKFDVLSSHAGQAGSLMTIPVFDMVSYISKAIYNGHTMIFEVHPKGIEPINSEVRVSVMTSAPSDSTPALRSKTALLYRACESLSVE